MGCLLGLSPSRSRLVPYTTIGSIEDDGIVHVYSAQTDAPWGIARLSSLSTLPQIPSPEYPSSSFRLESSESKVAGH
jgi:hypothetical protein